MIPAHHKAGGGSSRVSGKGSKVCQAAPLLLAMSLMAMVLVEGFGRERFGPWPKTSRAHHIGWTAGKASVPRPPTGESAPRSGKTYDGNEPPDGLASGRGVVSAFILQSAIF